MIRVAIIQFGEETNTFVPGTLEMTDLTPNGWGAAKQVEEQFTGIALADTGGYSRKDGKSYVFIFRADVGIGPYRRRPLI